MNWTANTIAHTLVAIGGMLFVALPAPAAAAPVFLDTIACNVQGASILSCSPQQAQINPAVQFSHEFFIASTNPLRTFFRADFSPIGLESAVLDVTTLNQIDLSVSVLQFRNLTGFWDRLSVFNVAGFGPLNPQSDGLTPSDFTLSGGLLSIDLRGSRAIQGNSFRLQLFEGPPPVAAIPEPASWALMIAGFGLVGGAIRRRRDMVRVTYA